MEFKDFYSHLLESVSSSAIDYYAKYLSKYSYTTESEAREDLRKKVNNINARQPDFLKYTKNQIEDLVYEMPIYKKNKKYKIGNRPKKQSLTIEDFDIKWTNREMITTSGLFASMDIKKVEYKFLDYKKINPTEGTDPNHVNKIVENIKENGWVKSIVVDNIGNISDGHHRYDALVKMGIKKIPCSIVITNEI